MKILLIANCLDIVSYTYNDRSELTGALSDVDTTYSYSYAYDPIGNRITASEAGVPWTYTTNSLNQYTSATENNVQVNFAYDLDGSMTYRPVDAISGWTQVWNAENRMVETSKGTDRLTFQYDYMGRRVEKCVYSNNNLTSRILFVYDGFKCVEELDGLDNNTVLMRHSWQPSDVGLDIILATTELSATSYFLHDANKNVMQKTAINGTLLEKYTYAGEYGGKKLYGFLENSSISKYDSLGYSAVSPEISGCLAKCSLKKIGSHFTDMFYSPFIRFSIYSYCMRNSSLPRIEDIFQNFLPPSQSVSSDAFDCVKNCLASLVKIKGIQIPFLDKILDIKQEFEFSNRKTSIKCDDTNKKVIYSFFVISKYTIRVIGSEEKHSFNHKEKEYTGTAGGLIYCACCSSIK